MDGCELLQCPQPTEAEHRPFAPSEWLARILRLIFVDMPVVIPLSVVQLFRVPTDSPQRHNP